MVLKWNKEMEDELLQLRDIDKKSFKEISKIMNTTQESVKAKYIRLHKKANKDTYHHPVEKINQVDKVLKNKNNLKILEAHAGWGNLTKVYSNYSKETLSLEIDKDRVDSLVSDNVKNTTVIKCDSELKIHELVSKRSKFDVVDLDPYGFPSRYLPHVFMLIDDGFLFITFPKIGVNKVNKVMKEHYRTFWDIDDTSAFSSSKNEYLEHIKKRIAKYAMCHYRTVELLDYYEVDMVYRMCFKVEKKSAFELTGQIGSIQNKD